MKYIAITIALAAIIIGGLVLLREKPEVVVQETSTRESPSSVEIPETATSVPEPTKPSTTIKNNITIKNGMTIETTKQGTGEAITNGKVASMLYTGMLDDGTVFDSTSKRDNTPFEFTLGVGQVIKGWDQGVLGMKVGEERTLVIPAELAYGSQGAGGVIPPNATLTFTVTLLAIK